MKDIFNGVAVLLRQGIYVPLDGSRSLRGFLEDNLGMDRNYAENRIQTILLDGLAADGLDKALVRSGTRLALSAAMPGVAGATLRREGAYAVMRKDITASNVGMPSGNDAEGWVELRCFNDIAVEQAENMLKHGFAAPGNSLPENLAEISAALPGKLPAAPRGDLVWLKIPRN